MGQGFSLTTLSAGSAGIDVPELSDLQYERSLNNTARFMKSVRARHKDGLVVTKVFVKPYSNMPLDKYVKKILHERKVLADVPNALAYHRVIETGTNGYLARQYIHSSLYDRLSIRPFLEDIEKKWLSFQLLCAVRDCHARGIYHGDIKTENCLVTSWNWLYLSDFSSSFKDTYLPEDNPADFSFFFDMSGRRTCYLAPERFLPPGVQAEGEQDITWAMDIFSVGCVIAELFLEAPIFSLSQLFQYKQREYDPVKTHLSKIRDESIRELVTHMIQLDPNSRLQADDYLTFWKGTAFPDYFFGFLQQYMYSITDPATGRKPVTSASENLGEADERIEKIYHDFDKISVLLSGDGNHMNGHQRMPLQSASQLFPLWVDIPNYQHQVSLAPSPGADDGNLIFLTIVVSCLRGTARASARLRGCDLLLAFAERLTDEAKLDRVIPYITNMLTDDSDEVKMAALQTMTQILAMVSVVSPVNAHIFPEYILQRLENFLIGAKKNPSSFVRAHYAWCIGTLATTASRYLDMMQSLRADGSFPTTDPEAEQTSMTASAHRESYDADRSKLLSKFESHTKALLTDPEASVRRAMLMSVSDLCVFFGSPRANDVVLSHLNTYLNDRDWMLKCAFFDAIVGVAIFVGGAGLEGFILPLMVQALTDPEEFVIERSLRAFSSIAELGLFQRSKTWELVDIIARLTMHPNLWIREAAAQFISAASKYLSVADTHSILINIIKPYLKVVPSEFSELRLLDCLKPPLPKIVMDKATNWALAAEKGLFWAPARQQRTFTLGSGENTLPIVSGRELDPKILQNTAKNDEDNKWLGNLRSAGLTVGDEFKLVALKEFIWRVAMRRRSDGVGSSNAQFNNIIALKDIDIIPQTVVFDDTQRLNEQEHRSVPPGEQYSQPRTIADALRDASTENETHNRRRNSPAELNGERRSSGEYTSRRNSMPTVPRLSTQIKDLRSGQGASSHPVPTQNTLQVPNSAGSPSTLSSVGSAGGASLDGRLRHRGSAITLLHKGESKAIAETATASINAFGEVDGAPAQSSSRPPNPPSPVAVEKPQRTKSVIRYREAHNYTGHDPTVLKLLDSVLLEKFPENDAEFGPQIQLSSRKQPVKRRETHPEANGVPWRPEGVMVAMLGEHTAAVRRILVAPGHAFFITGSDDGTVKVWDPSRFERNVTRRSRQTFRLTEGAKVSSLVFVENTYSFVVTGTDGSVTVVRIDYSQGQSGAKFGRLMTVRDHQLPSGEYAVWSEHYKDDNKSMLFLATNTNKVLALDLRSMEILFTLHNPPDHGTPTCFCLDRKHHWLLLGTSHGVLDLWDLRFKLRLKAWGFQGGSPINRIVLHPIRTKKPRVYVAGGTGQGEVTVWDLEKLVCKEVYRTGGSKDTGTKSTTLIDLDEEKAGGMLGRFSTSSSVEPNANSVADKGVRALVVCAQAIEEGGELKNTFLVTSGPDWKVRFWDAGKGDGSCIVSGLEAGEGRAGYVVRQPVGDTIIVEEKLSLPQLNQHATVGRRDRERERERNRDGRSGERGSREKGRERSSRNGLIGLQQQMLLKSHLDGVVDVAFLERPYGMVVSGDRSGVVMIFI
ncbi:phosphoinositide 3-kinase regulatory subunit 4 [Delitschia confertaspora ATCC 74209]|uniref:non-specific serine/threonine protein kinase n=1 Tax=Delitschia confertaspora ATCC 74209 TaxID=1513339 RepID=A0A9P4N356_9PLEO|nr:phosphoinositide 3-kinase regulatory subunit 4 [Delitschia confertaspora ATCC 74209]